MAELVAAALFGLGYAAISMEHRLFVNKAAASLILAVVLWIVASLTVPAEVVQDMIMVAGADIFGIMLFLLTSMTLVEVLIHYHLFDILEHWLRSRGWTFYHLGWAMAGIAFIFSAVVDNLTTTIVAMQISRRLFPIKHLIPVGALVVIASNAGGAFSPIGDITTLMLWFAHKFSASEIVAQGIFPCLALLLVAGLMLLRFIPKELCGTSKQTIPFTTSRSDKIIITATLASFFLPLAMTPLGIPPYMGRLLALGFVWLLIDFAKKARPQQTHLQAKIQKFFQHADIESLKFFIGILLAVAALDALGVLDIATKQLLGPAPELFRLIAAFSGLGIASAFVDNVPLTAAAISSLTNVSSSLWTLLAITVGTGGSLFIIGSAAGIVAMGMMPEMTFTKYLRVGTLPAIAGFSAAVGTWLLQSWIFS